MKVIKAEIPKWTIATKCTGCKGRLEEIEASDINYYVSDEEALAQHYNVDVVGTFSVICPDCGQKNKLSSNKIPPAIQAKIIRD